MTRPTTRAGRLGRLVLAAMLAATGLSVAVMARQQAAHASYGGGDFFALRPGSPGTRVLDTRSSTPLAPLGERDLVVADGTNIPSNATSMILNVTIIKPTVQTFLTVWPTGTPRPNTTSVGSPASPTSGNYNASATVAIGSGGQVSIYNQANANVDVVVDVEGYTSAGTGVPAHGGWQPLMNPVTMDTRTGAGVAKAKVPANGSLSVLIGTGPAMTNQTMTNQARQNVTAKTSATPVGTAQPGSSGGVTANDVPRGPAPPRPTNIPEPVVYDSVPIGTNAAFGEVTVANNTANGTLTMRTTDETDPLTGSLGFQAGGTSTGLVLRIGSDGRTVFINHSSASIDLSLTIPGFWTTNGSGSTLFPYQNRSLAGQTVAASGTFTIPSELVNNYPAPDVEGALIKVTVAGQASTGGFSVQNGNGYGGTVLYTTPGQAHSSLLLVGPDGATIKNLQTTSMRISVDVEGYFGNGGTPVDLTPASTPTLRQASTADGLDMAYVTADGRLRHGFTTTPDSQSPQWETVTSVPVLISGQVAMSPSSDGRSEWIAFQSAADSQIWLAAVPIGASWNSALYTRTGASESSPPALATMPNAGPPAVFVTTADCYVEAFYNGTWSVISNKPVPVTLDGGGSSNTNSSCSVSDPPRAFADSTGIEVVTPDAGVIGHFTGTSNMTWGPNYSRADGQPWSAAYGARVLAARLNTVGAVETAQQTGDGSYFSDWTATAALLPGTPALAGAPSVIYDALSHRFVILVRDVEGGLLENVETSAGSGAFTNPWTQLGNPGAATDVGLTQLFGSTLNGWAGLYIGADGSEYQIRLAS